MKVALDVQHMYKNSHPNDRGERLYGLYETEIVKNYMSKAKILLEAKGIEVCMSDPGKKILVGDYWERHAFANDNHVHLYLAGHMNTDITQKDCGIVEHTVHAGRETVIFAHILKNRIKENLNIGEVVLKTLAEKEIGYACIAGLRMPAVLIKPLSLHNHNHIELLKKEGVYLIAETIADAIEEYMAVEIGE